jgi:hypothetical protein
VEAVEAGVDDRPSGDASGVLPLRDEEAGGVMPVTKVSGGYRWGSKGKVFKRKADAERQGRAIRANQNRAKKRRA